MGNVHGAVLGLPPRIPGGGGLCHHAKRPVRGRGGAASCPGALPLKRDPLYTTAMRYISTRGKAPARDFAGVLLAGLAEDGGLFVPESWPVFAAADWRAMRACPIPLSPRG